MSDHELSQKEEEGVLALHALNESMATATPRPRRRYNERLVPEFFNGREFFIAPPAMPEFVAPATEADRIKNGDILMHCYKMLCKKLRLRGKWDNLPPYAKKSLAKKVAGIYYEAGIRSPLPFMEWRLDSTFYAMDEAYRKENPGKKLPARRMVSFPRLTSCRNIEDKVALAKRLGRFEPLPLLHTLPPAAVERSEYVMRIRAKLADPDTGREDDAIDAAIVADLYPAELQTEHLQLARKQVREANATLKARYLKGEWLW